MKTLVHIPLLLTVLSSAAAAQTPTGQDVNASISATSGWALRASATYQVARHWSMEPYFLRWHVSASPVSDETVSFTVKRVTAEQQLGAYEPLNVTREFGVKLGVHF